MLAALMLFIGLTSCKKLSSYDYPAQATAYGILKEDISFTYFRYIVDRTGTKELLDNKGNYTVFAPTNGAFLNAGYTMNILSTMSMDSLTTLTKNHILDTKKDLQATNGQVELTTMSSLKVLVQKIGENLYIDGGDISSADVAITNGGFNVINKVLDTKSTLKEAIFTYSHATTKSQLTFLLAAITKASTGSVNIDALLDQSTPYTFFAPNNGAFIDAGYATLAAVNAADADVLGNLLKYHFIAGSKLTTEFDSVAVASSNGVPIYFDNFKPFNGRTTYWYANGVTFGNGSPSNIIAKNGVMHVVSRMLPVPVAETTLQLIRASADLTMFNALIQRASTVSGGLNFEAMLSASSSYTVFAINNAGLQAEGYADVAAINSEPAEILADILKFHILPKRVNNMNIAENSGVNTLLKITNAAGVESNTAITFLVTGGFKVKGGSNINTVPVITGNIVTTNGVLNVIGTVLKP